jgi:choline dehydrogenase-like flavoprotein
MSGVHIRTPSTNAVSDDRTVVVIGSGPSGCMAALALVRRGIPVLHLESGRSVPRGWLVRGVGTNLFRVLPRLPASNGQHIASGDPETVWFQAFMPGGLSNHWTGAVPRFAPEDFTDGERLHEQYRWPVSYEDLVPYYEEVERLLVVSASQQDVPALPAGYVRYPKGLPRAWEQVAAQAPARGQGLVPLPMADGAAWMVSRRGTAFNSYVSIGRLLACSPHYKLMLGAHATRLEWNGSKKRVDSVIYVDRATREERRLQAAAIVVAAGPLGSTRLLLNSTSNDFPSGLGDTHGLLGRFLHDHRVAWGRIKIASPLPRLSHAAYLTRASYAECAPLLAASCTVGNADDTAMAKMLARTPIKARVFGIVTFASMVPRPDNHVRLAPSTTDEFGVPLLEIYLRIDDEVDKTASAARQRLCAILDAAGYRPTVLETVIKMPGASTHYGGTVRMHTSLRYGMLNEWNRLHAVGNVVVADASSFTTGVEKHPTLTGMALAARAGEKLAEDLRRT